MDLLMNTTGVFIGSVIYFGIKRLTIHYLEVQYSVPIVCAMVTFSAIQEGYYVGKGYEII